MFVMKCLIMVGFSMIMDSDKTDAGDTVCETDQGSAGPLPASQLGSRCRRVDGPQVVAEVVPPTHPDAQAAAGFEEGRLFGVACFFSSILRGPAPCHLWCRHHHRSRGRSHCQQAL